MIIKRGGEVGRERVIELRGSLHHYGPANAGWIVTTGNILSGAREEAAQPGTSPITSSTRSPSAASSTSTRCWSTTRASRSRGSTSTSTTSSAAPDRPRHGPRRRLWRRRRRA
ncbi:MAG: restriction endonuclease [Polyangiales bacterium]